MERYTAEEAASHFCVPGRDPERHARLVACIRRLWNGDSTQIAWCPSCRFGFGWPHVGGDAEYYSIIHEQLGYTAWRWEYGRTIEAASARFPSGGRCIDIGAGDGSFLMSMPRNWSRSGIESTETTRALLRSKSIEVYSGLEEAIAKAGGTVQLVTLFQVIEHVAEFAPMLEGVRRLLVPDGLLVMSTPFSDDLRRQQAATGCPDMPPNHINKWNRESMARALSNAGLRAESFEIEPASWGSVAYSLYLRVRADAQFGPRSIAAQAYRVRNRRWRGMCLRGLGLLAAPRLLPHLSEARLSANFMVVAGLGPARGQGENEENRS